MPTSPCLAFALGISPDLSAGSAVNADATRGWWRPVSEFHVEFRRSERGASTRQGFGSAFAAAADMFCSRRLRTSAYSCSRMRQATMGAWQGIQLDCQLIAEGDPHASRHHDVGRTHHKRGRTKRRQRNRTKSRDGGRAAVW